MRKRIFAIVFVRIERRILCFLFFFLSCSIDFCSVIISVLVSTAHSNVYSGEHRFKSVSVRQIIDFVFRFHKSYVQFFVYCLTSRISFSTLSLVIVIGFVQVNFHSVHSSVFWSHDSILRSTALMEPFSIILNSVYCIMHNTYGG